MYVEPALMYVERESAMHKGRCVHVSSSYCTVSSPPFYSTSVLPYPAGDGHTEIGAAVIFPFAAFRGALSHGRRQINPRRAVPIVEQTGLFLARNCASIIFLSSFSLDFKRPKWWGPKHMWISHIFIWPTRDENQLMSNVHFSDHRYLD